MRKIGYIVLILIILMPSFGYFLIFKIQQHFAQTEMLKQLNNDLARTEKIMLSFADFKKNQVDDHEIFFNGKMYDIKLVKYSGNLVELLVINDTKEEKILEKINYLITHSHHGHNNQINHLINLLSQIYIFSVAQNEYALKTVLSRFPSFCESIRLNNLDITSPPPKLVC